MTPPVVQVAPHEVRARAFDEWAEEYERFRPGYPDALFDVIASRLRLPDDAAVLDVGAGTGKVARAMARRGWRVTALDPGERMLAVLRRRAAEEGLSIDAVRATAEDTGVRAASFDAAVAGEAYHWFDAPVALRELGRAVRPGGGVSFFWNVVDEDRSGLVSGERRLVHEHGVSGGDVRRPGPNPETRAAIRAVGAYEEPIFVQVPHVVPMTGAEYRSLAFTKSHLRTAPCETQEAFGQAFDGLLASHGIGSNDRFEVPYVVDCWIARRAST